MWPDGEGRRNLIWPLYSLQSRSVLLRWPEGQGPRRATWAAPRGLPQRAKMGLWQKKSDILSGSVACVKKQPYWSTHFDTRSHTHSHTYKLELTHIYNYIYTHIRTHILIDTYTRSHTCTHTQTYLLIQKTHTDKLGTDLNLVCFAFESSPFWPGLVCIWFK